MATKKDPPPLNLKRANIIQPTGPRRRGRFELRDERNQVVGSSDHSTSSDASIQGSAQNIVEQARGLKRRIRLKSGEIIDPEEDDDGESVDTIAPRRKGKK